MVPFKLDRLYYLAKASVLCIWRKKSIMGIRQQEDIRSFLTRKLDGDIACELYDHQSKLLDELISHTSDKTANQMKTLKETILPRIALYKALAGSSLSRERALGLMQSYMMDVVAVQKHASTAKMEAVPGFSASTSMCSCVSCAQATCGRALRSTVAIFSTPGSRSAFGTTRVWRTAAPSYARCSATLTM